MDRRRIDMRNDERIVFREIVRVNVLAEDRSPWPRWGVT